MAILLHQRKFFFCRLNDLTSACIDCLQFLYSFRKFLFGKNVAEKGTQKFIRKALLNFQQN